jgi:hypothetical protein
VKKEHKVSVEHLLVKEISMDEKIVLHQENEKMLMGHLRNLPGYLAYHRPRGHPR